jgi:hypothetical protein
MAMLWAAANALPAATLPIPACATAATVPNGWFRRVRCCLKLGRELTGDRPDGAKANNAQESRGQDGCQGNADSSASNGTNDSTGPV